MDLLGLPRLVPLALEMTSQHVSSRCVAAVLVRLLQLVPQKHAGHSRPPRLVTTNSCCSLRESPFPIVVWSHGLDSGWQEFADYDDHDDEEGAIPSSATRSTTSPVCEDYIVLLVHQSYRSVSCAPPPLGLITC